MATSEQLEFWGTIIKAGQSVRVDIDEDDEEHVSLSLVALGSSTTEEEEGRRVVLCARGGRLENCASVVPLSARLVPPS